MDAYELLFMEEAAATLQASLCSLQLTELELKNVDLGALEGFQRLPPGNLTNLRQAANWLCMDSKEGKKNLLAPFLIP